MPNTTHEDDNIEEPKDFYVGQDMNTFIQGIALTQVNMSHEIKSAAEASERQALQLEKNEKILDNILEKQNQSAIDKERIMKEISINELNRTKIEDDVNKLFVDNRRNQSDIAEVKEYGLKTQSRNKDELTKLIGTEVKLGTDTVWNKIMLIFAVSGVMFGIIGVFMGIVFNGITGSINTNNMDIKSLRHDVDTNYRNNGKTYSNLEEYKKASEDG